ncbi:hypothetical protein EV385_4322 [Krasilnikovia cinnamomea]|uniref:Uncharacterized protein n=1 Tax=Krasilnikovia cinnamomea TaxID=349313 RepID=A0A4Q7ZQ29_9ACTN|nr:hypothetical protein [Krasilnikovia cinnamomea]RZU52459.1 hypothetical protein EV385_4322 [Krasilnikovia cinnamomea]
MPKDKRGVERSRFGVWWHDTFDDWFFRSLIGPAQTGNAVHGADPTTRQQWLRDLERRKQYTREQRERRRLAREKQGN